MIIERLSVENAKMEAAEQSFAYIRYMSRVFLGKNDTENIEWEQILDARFFGEKDKEIRFFMEGNTLKAVCCTAEANDEYIEETIDKLQKGFGSSIKKRKYLSADEDGQKYITRVCLSDWKE